jgi:hypothetical protein
MLSDQQKHSNEPWSALDNQNYDMVKYWCRQSAHLLTEFWSGLFLFFCCLEAKEVFLEAVNAKDLFMKHNNNRKIYPKTVIS